MVSRDIKTTVHWAQEDLTDLFEQRPGLAHLRIHKRGDSLALISGEGDDEQKHARLTYIDSDIWGLSFPRSNGSWEPAPFTGTITELIELLARDFPDFLTHY